MTNMTPAAVETLHGHEHRKRITRALTGVYTSVEHQTAPDSPEHEIVARALQRAAHAYDQLAKARIGQLLPNTLGKAVLVTPLDER